MNTVWKPGIEDTRIESIQQMIPPGILKDKNHQPLSKKSWATVRKWRASLDAILGKKDDRLAVIVGPCSIHEIKSAKEYAERIQEVRKEFGKELEIVLRAYFEKPRTDIGWKGLIMDPDRDGTNNISRWLEIARWFLLYCNNKWIPCATEFLDAIIPQYIADLIAYGAIGARTTESQIHRQLASGLSMPVGFKNGTSGSIQMAVDAVKAANNPHSFLSVTDQWTCAIVETVGNELAHIILRWGKETNFDAESIESARSMLEKKWLLQSIVVDASHGNSRKDHRNQPGVVTSLAQQIWNGNISITGVMIESHLVEGKQNDTGNDKNNTYGQSITDACVWWETTEEMLRELAKVVRERRSKK